MSLSFSIKLAGLAAIFFSTSTSAVLGKTSLWGAGISPLIDQGLWQYLTPTQSTQDQWSAGWIPQRCADAAHSDQLSPSDFEVFNVHYTDCGSPWVFCRHRNAKLTQTDMIDLFGRLPVHERQWIQHVVAIPGANSGYMSSAVVVFRGSVGTPSVFQHEVGHSLDFYKNGFQASDRWEFWDAIRQDTCVPDNYANTNNIEDFAQIGVVSLFAIANPGGLDPAFGWTWHCLLNQFTIYNAFQMDAMVPGGACTRRWADSPIISMSTARIGDGATKPKAANVLGQPGIFAIPFERTTEDTVFENLVVNETEREAAISRQETSVQEAKFAREAKRAKRAKM